MNSSPDNDTTPEQGSVMDAAHDLTTVRRYEQGERESHPPFVLLGNQQIDEFKIGVRSLELSMLEEIATIAQVEIERRHFEAEREHHPTIFSAYFSERNAVA